jgi:hypothetical protein
VQVLGELTRIRDYISGSQFQAAINALAVLVKNIQAEGITTQVPVPGFQHGLSYVPFDEFPARLHRGERVLTAGENADFMRLLARMGSGESRPSGDRNLTINVTVEADPMADPERIATAVKKAVVESLRFGAGGKLVDEKIQRRR